MKKIIFIILVSVLIAAIGAIFYFWWHNSKAVSQNNQPSQSPVTFIETPRPYQTFPSIPDLYQKPAENTVIKFPVFNYHHLGPLPENADENRQAFTVTPEVFEEQLKYFKDNGYQPVYLDELIEYFDTGRPLPSKAIAITFDDGYQEHYQNAFPLLKKYGFVATFFVIIDWVGRPDMMSWANIKEMSEAGMAFGSHTLSHPHLTDLSDEDLKREVEESKKALEENLGRPVNFISYPGGNYNERVIEAVKAAGYKGALGVYKIINQMPKYCWSIRRFHADDNMESITSKLTDY